MVLIASVVLLLSSGSAAASNSAENSRVARALAASAVAPTVTAVSPASGVPAGGGRVTVSGSGFVSGASVSFSGTTGSEVSVLSTTRLTVTAPEHAAGVVNVRVTTSSGISSVSTADRYSYAAGSASGELAVVAGRCVFDTAQPATHACIGASAVAIDSGGNRYVADGKNRKVEKVAPDGSLSVVAGSGKYGRPKPGPATASPFGGPGGLAVDGAGNLYIVDDLFSVAVKVTPDGTLSIVAGTGNSGPPTPGPATNSHLANPSAVALDAAGNLYIADAGNQVVERVTPDGTLSIFAGTGNRGAPTPGPATSSDLNYPDGVAVDASGNVFIADSGNYLVERVTPGGTLSIFAGTGASGRPTPGRATNSDLGYLSGVAVDPSGRLYIADNYYLVERVTPGGTLSIVAGTGGRGAPTPGPATSSTLNGPVAVAVDAGRTLYIADYYVVEKVTPGGTLSIAAGVGDPRGTPRPGPATSSSLDGPEGVAVDSAGNLYVADSGNDVIEKVTPAGTLSIVAGTGNPGAPTPGPATSSDLAYPYGVAVDAAGNLYIADSGNDVVEKVTPAGMLSIVAGTGESGAPTSGSATSSDLNEPEGVALDSAGNLYIADTRNGVVEKVTTRGQLVRVAGNGKFDEPRPGPATRSPLDDPAGVTVDSAGDLYIADLGNQVVERVTPDGTLSIFAGTGYAGAPTPGSATESDLRGPQGVAVDASGNVFIADSDNQVVERVDPGGTLSIVAGNRSRGAPTPGPATRSDLSYPTDVTVDPAGDLFIADSLNFDVEKVAH